MLRSIPLKRDEWGFRASEDKDIHFSHIANRILCERDERKMAVTITDVRRHLQHADLSFYSAFRCVT
jgi:hypothetical protein